MLFLFDIDGTLLRRLPPAHRHALCEACQRVFDVVVHPDAVGRTAGMTDSAILVRMLATAGVSRPDVTSKLPTLCSVAADAYDRLATDDLGGYHTPHALEALAWLRARGAALGLVTGNIQRIAWRKLAKAGLAQPFRVGAFGDEAEARDQLPPLAWARAQEELGRQFRHDEVFVVGDTPSDIGCGKASGFRTIGVATGPEHTVEELRTCDPDYLIENLSGLQGLDLYGQR
jgi:phosphoglycolate phosphatase-like HAD superfamily hydrolase